ncbi:MAG: bifunctional riboflavin kinase/FAD synthetase [Lachnospiraceae bacterium]|nr:bifunctional riboflavin kinase/FAD synthetase [Lachnospiraceae bacterium]
MKILTSLDYTIAEPTAVTVGKFDGIHKGHDILTRHLLRQEERGLQSLVVTFDVSPRLRLQKDMEKQLITNDERKNLLEKQGISYLAECSFEDIMPLEPEAFIELLVQRYHMKYLVCGTDFHFGKKGRGDVKLLERLSADMGFELEVVEKLKAGEREISSTYVREEIAKGNVAKGNELLGYEYFIWGTVVHGNHLGTKIGIPTINLIPPEDKLLPKNGVYITRVEIDHRIYHGVTNVGVKPTIHGERQVGVETHILDFDQDIYERQVCITFLKHLRDEICFSSVDELKKQMQQDKKAAYEFFNQKKC